MTARRRRFRAFVLSFGLALAAAAGLVGGDWSPRCPESGATGWMDCGGQPDAIWESSSLPGWVTPELLLGAGLLGALGVAATVVLELRARR